jgi:1,4-alpha-glucan branching enzyme
VRFVTAGEYLSAKPSLQTLTPAPSSWGYRGHSETWIDRSNSWIYRHLHRAAKVMTETAGRNRNADRLKTRALNQAARELLMAQASDWPFMMKRGELHDFAKIKFEEHMKNFLSLHGQIVSDDISEKHLTMLEDKNCIFADLDYRIFIDD